MQPNHMKIREFGFLHNLHSFHSFSLVHLYLLLIVLPAVSISVFYPRKPSCNNILTSQPVCLSTQSLVSPVHSTFTIIYETAICIETPSKNHSSGMMNSVKHTCYLQQLSNLTRLVTLDTFKSIPYYYQLQDTQEPICMKSLKSNIFWLLGYCSLFFNSFTNVMPSWNTDGEK